MAGNDPAKAPQGAYMMHQLAGKSLIAKLFTGAAFLLCFLVIAGGVRAQTELLNASYDPTRELYRELNTAFIAEWNANNPARKIRSIRQSHCGSGSQARAVIDAFRRRTCSPQHEILRIFSAGAVSFKARGADGSLHLFFRTYCSQQGKMALSRSCL
jgi:hypothetical protein